METSSEARISALEDRVNGLRQQLRLVRYGWVLTVAIVLFGVWVSRWQADSSKTDAKSILHVRGLIVEDNRGVDRVVIGAPVPDPRMRGVVSRRRNPAFGILLNDAQGNERAGFAAMDDGSAILGIDDELSRERADLYFIPGRGAGLLLQAESGGAQASLLVPPESEPSRTPALNIVDATGKATAQVPPASPK